MINLCIRQLNVLNFCWNGCLDLLWIAVVLLVGLDRNTSVTAGTTVENKGKLILNDVSCIAQGR